MCDRLSQCCQILERSEGHLFGPEYPPAWTSLVRRAVRSPLRFTGNESWSGLLPFHGKHRTPPDSMDQSTCANSGPLRRRGRRPVMEMRSLPSASRVRAGDRRALPIQRDAPLSSGGGFTGNCAQPALRCGGAVTPMIRYVRKACHPPTSCVPRETASVRGASSSAGREVHQVAEEAAAAMLSGSVRARVRCVWPARAGRSCAAPMSSVSTVIGHGRFHPVVVPAGLIDRCGSSRSGSVSAP